MKRTPRYLKVIEEIERDWIPALKNLFRYEFLEGLKFTLWDLTGWHENYDPYVLGDEATEEQKREGLEISVRMKKIMARILREEHERLMREVEQDEADGPEAFYREKKE